MDKIKLHYKEESKKMGASKQATMKDINVRDKEVERIAYWIKTLQEYSKKKLRVLEVGCGNGYTSAQISKELDVELVCVDFCEDFIGICKKRKLRNVTFALGNAKDLKFDDDSFDIVFTERCLINLASWEDQRKALEEITRVIKRGGHYIMVEAFTDGLSNLNMAQEALGIEPKRQPAHNCYFDKTKLLSYVNTKYERFYDEEADLDSKRDENFLSSYFFGSRVIYPALIRGFQDITYNNKFVEFFTHLPAFGNYSTIQLFVFGKI